MRPDVLPTLVLALLSACSSPDRQGRETGLGSAGAGFPDTGLAAAGDTDSASTAWLTPAGILSQLDIANTTEIQVAQKAARNAARTEIRQLAKKLAADHTMNREQLRALAQRLNLRVTPPKAGEPSASDSSSLSPDLTGRTGLEFDRAFVQSQVEEHQESIQKIRTQLLPAAQSPDMRAYLQKTVAELQDHLALLGQAQHQLGT